jgi:pterin-4a-carbinolamine dehydratase
LTPPPTAALHQRHCVGLTTHVAGGLTENDFVLAARIDKIGSTG